MKKTWFFLFGFIISFSLYSQNSISDFEDSMNLILNASSENKWEFRVTKRMDSKLYASLIIWLSEETTTEEAAEIRHNISNLVNETYPDIDVQTVIGRSIHFMENISPISYADFEKSDKDYFNLGSFLAENEYISWEESNSINTPYGYSYREEGSDNLITGLKIYLLVDIYFDYNKLQEIKKLMESKLDIEWLE